MDELRLLGGVVNGPAFLPAEIIDGCASYRQAVRASWLHRRINAMTQRTLAERTECYASHVSDYLHADDRSTRRNLPAEKLNLWAAAVGNWGVQQWLMHQAKLTLMEEVIAARAAA
ncbi:XRE family transcriptional regulator [Cupriavidus sp. 2TAF22]|uniref:XRE family transcriptional regulator n=1 Tax=unclassified Cupriavidus TaxID=2640874 RepID=UPI003F9079BB